MLELKDLKKSFGNIHAVDDLTLEIREGEIFGLLGPNGAGKTTTINMAVGLLRPDSGSVSLRGGGPPTDFEVRSKIGVAPQALAIYEDLSGEENLRFFGTLQGLKGKHLKQRVTWVLEFVDLAERARDRVKTYSGGMKRRLNLAVALVHDPDLLLLDEPTVGVDPQSRNAIFERIATLRDEGRTVVYTTHYMEEAQRLCDRVGIIDHGRLLAMDTVEGLIGAHGGLSVIYVDRGRGEERLESADPMNELLKIHEAGNVVSFKVDSPDLECVFLNLTGRHLRDN
ncbi:MAG: ABC transporter ATP-binding protein [bacterium]|jgi:ABC-2 type transport system ATP-binding protein